MKAFVAEMENIMTEKNENRRVRMTKRLMKDALLELLAEKDLANISVTAVCETADVHRSTFYNYYTDPADLLRDIEQDFLQRLPASPEILDLQNEKALLASTSDFFDFVKDNQKTVRILFNSSSGSRFAARMVDHLCNGFILLGENPDEVTARFTQLYIANGAVSMLREWVNTDFPLSSREIAEMMYTLSRRVSQY